MFYIKAYAEAVRLANLNKGSGYLKDLESMRKDYKRICSIPKVFYMFDEDIEANIKKAKGILESFINTETDPVCFYQTDISSK